LDLERTYLTRPNQLSLCFEYHRGKDLPMSTNVPSDMSSMCMAFDAFTSHDVSDSLVEEHNQSLTQAQNDLLQ